MIFNRIQMLRNKPIRIARENEGEYLFVQGPTIGEIYEDEKLFLASQILTMQDKELKKFLNIDIEDLNKMGMITMILTRFSEKEIMLERFQKIILGLNINKGRIFVDKDPLKEKELERIEEILLIILGQRREDKEEKPEEENLSPQEKRMKELEEKVRAKKEKAKEQNDDDNIIENIMISVIYEFGFSIEQIMNMNYFTLIWYYSYTGKLHVYRINQHAIGSGMVKKINTDYFTSLK